jgi:hypothetical protein
MSVLLRANENAKNVSHSKNIVKREAGEFGLAKNAMLSSRACSFKRKFRAHVTRLQL